MCDAYALLGRENHLAMEAGELRARMDQHGIQTAVVRSMGAELAVENRAGNERVLGAGPRLRGLASVNPWFGAQALDELARCRDIGAVGLFLHPSRQGFMPTEPVADPVIDAAARFDWPVVFHTGTYVQSDVLAVVEVARRYPAIPFLLAAGGFADMWFEIPGAMAAASNLWLETSLVRADSVQTAAEACGGWDRIVFGSGEPRGRYERALRSIERLTLTPAQRRAVLGGNARRLYRLEEDATGTRPGAAG